MTHVVDIHDRVIYSGPFEESLRELRTRAGAKKVLGADGVLLATTVPHNWAALFHSFSSEPLGIGRDVTRSVFVRGH